MPVPNMSLFRMGELDSRVILCVNMRRTAPAGECEGISFSLCVFSSSNYSHVSAWKSHEYLGLG